MAEKYARHLCYHEAGHAVVAFCLNIKVIAVSIANGPGTDAVCTEPVPFMDQLAMCFAGGVAQELCKQPAPYVGATLHDQIMAETLLRGLANKSVREKIRKAARKRALKYLKPNKIKIVRIAEQLAERGRLDETEFLQLME
jgi:ATP-dependent Zn protease